MKRTLLIVLLGLTGGLLVHVGWFISQQPCRANGLDCQLEWMKTELKLSDEQFARIKSIHEQSSPRLLALAAQVARMRDEYDAFEHERTTSGQIDFLEFAHFVEQRRAVDRECLTSTQRLVADAARVMTAQQRKQYLGLLSPVLQAGAHLSIN
jgi:predicted nucleotidyltransferase component of viral defense system